MNFVVLIGAVLLQTVVSYGQGHSEGGGSYSYSDSSGKRYSGVYGLKDGKVVNQQGNFPPNFQPPNFEEPNFQDLDYLGDFFPAYFKNLENILEDAGFPYMPPTPFLPSTPFMPRPPRPTFAMPSPTPFVLNRHYGAYSPYDDYNYSGGYHTGYNSYNNPSFGGNPYYGAPTFSPNNFKRAFKTSIESQKLAFDAARKAFDVTSNRAGYHNGNRGNTPFHDFDVPNFDRYPGFAGFDDAFRGGNANTAYASGRIGPGFKEQIAAINPENPSNPNIKVTRLNDPSSKGYKSVSVTSFSSSSDINGQKSNTRKASTIINDNGQISRYDVSN